LRLDKGFIFAVMKKKKRECFPKCRIVGRESGSSGFTWLGMLPVKIKISLGDI